MNHHLKMIGYFAIIILYASVVVTALAMAYFLLVIGYCKMAWIISGFIERIFLCVLAA